MLKMKFLLICVKGMDVKLTSVSLWRSEPLHLVSVTEHNEDGNVVQVSACRRPPQPSWRHSMTHGVTSSVSCLIWGDIDSVYVMLSNDNISWWRHVAHLLWTLLLTEILTCICDLHSTLYVFPFRISLTLPHNAFRITNRTRKHCFIPN